MEVELDLIVRVLLPHTCPVDFHVGDPFLLWPHCADQERRFRGRGGNVGLLTVLRARTGQGARAGGRS